MKRRNDEYNLIERRGDFERLGFWNPFHSCRISRRRQTSRVLLNPARPSDGRSSDLHCSHHHRVAEAPVRRADTRRVEGNHDEALLVDRTEAYTAEGIHELENLALDIQDSQNEGHQEAGGRLVGKELGMAHSRN